MVTRSDAGVHRQETLLGKNKTPPERHQLSLTPHYIVYWLKRELLTGYQFIASLCNYHQNFVGVVCFLGGILVWVGFFPPFHLAYASLTQEGLLSWETVFLIIARVSRTVYLISRQAEIWGSSGNKGQSIFRLSEKLSCKGPLYGSQDSYNRLHKQVTKYLVGWKMFKSTLSCEDLFLKTRDVSTLYQHFLHS